MKTTDKTALQEELATCRKELFDLKLNAMAGQVKDVSQFKKLRKKIARLLTTINGEKKSAHESI